MNIETEHLEMTFQGPSGIPVLKGIDFADDISTMAIIGPSGGGKSTFLRILAGLLVPTSGTVSIGGATIFPVPGQQKERRSILDAETLLAYRKTIGFVFQNGGLFKHLDGFSNIEIPLERVHGYSHEKAHERAEELLDRFGLIDDADKLPAFLSGGQQQRIAIARAIAAKPALLFLDEPTSALDPEYTVEVLDMVDELKEEGLDFIIVTHEMGFARKACDTVAFLKDGKLAEYGHSKQVFTHPKTPGLRQFLAKLLEWSD